MRHPKDKVEYWTETNAPKSPDLNALDRLADHGDCEVSARLRWVGRYIDRLDADWVSNGTCRRSQTLRRELSG